MPKPFAMNGTANGCFQESNDRRRSAHDIPHALLVSSYIRAMDATREVLARSLLSWLVLCQIATSSYAALSCSSSPLHLIAVPMLHLRVRAAWV